MYLRGHKPLHFLLKAILEWCHCDGKIIISGHDAGTSMPKVGGGEKGVALSFFCAALIFLQVRCTAAILDIQLHRAELWFHR